MLIKQISVFIENKSGRLAEITGLLGKEGINIHALSIADTTDFGILRLIVDTPEKAEKCLKDYGLTVKATDVIAITVAHVPGGLSKALEALDAEHIFIEYMYAFTGSSPVTQSAMVILRVDDQEKAIKVLEKTGVGVLTQEIVNKL